MARVLGVAQGLETETPNVRSLGTDVSTRSRAYEPELTEALRD
jgi:hypothetical protein